MAMRYRAAHGFRAVSAILRSRRPLRKTVAPSRAGKGFRDRAPDGAPDAVSPRQSQHNGGKSDGWSTRHGGNRPRLCENSEIACKRRIWSEFLPSAEPVMAENGRIPAEIHKMPPGHSSFHTAWTLKSHSWPRQRIVGLTRKRS